MLDGKQTPFQQKVFVDSVTVSIITFFTFTDNVSVEILVTQTGAARSSSGVPSTAIVELLGYFLVRLIVPNFVRKKMLQKNLRGK
ncbi:hypothetical protein K8R42_04115 [bacterium]|nr:hypothetical protein [bacterium]